MLNELQEDWKKKLNDTEKQILKARISELSIGQLEAKDLKVDVDLLIFKACAISGADLPTTDFFANILSQEMQKFLLDFGYQDYNIEEFLLAYRFNADGIKFPSGEWIEKIYFKGTLSINLSSEVFNNYRILRNTMDRKLQNKLDGYE